MLPSYQSWWGQSNIQLSPQNLTSNIICHEFKESCNFMSMTKKKKNLRWAWSTLHLQGNEAALKDLSRYAKRANEHPFWPNRGGLSTTEKVQAAFWHMSGTCREV